MKIRHIMMPLLLSAMALLHVDAAAQTSADSTAFVNADWNWSETSTGASIGYAQIRMFGGVQSVSIVKYPARKFRTAIVHSPGEAASTTDSIAMREGATLAINGSYFNMKTLYPHTFFAYHHEIVGESPVKELDRSNAIIAFKKKNGKKMEIFSCDTSKYEIYRKEYYTALASGPLLILDGKEMEFLKGKSFYEKRHPRSIVGKDDKGYNYFIVIDGRFPGQGDGATIKETAAIARYTGLTAAVNVDGGGSSTLWTEESGVINHPSDNKAFDHKGCRTVPNIIAAWK